MPQPVSWTSSIAMSWRNRATASKRRRPRASMSERRTRRRAENVRPCAGLGILGSSMCAQFALQQSKVDGHEGHSHAVKPDADARRLWIALGLIAGFMAAEVVVGILAHSLALLSDAAHMLTDAGALVLSLVVIG